VNAGKLRHRVSIQAPVRTPGDGQGGYAPSWATIIGGDVWAEVVPLSGSEAFEAGAIFGHTTHRVTIRHKTGISGRHSILMGSRRLYVRSVVNRDERDRTIDLICEEITT
jgi:SPP1 family predicted phage head-tail adaptor